MSVPLHGRTTTRGTYQLFTTGFQQGLAAREQRDMVQEERPHAQVLDFVLVVVIVFVLHVGGDRGGVQALAQRRGVVEQVQLRVEHGGDAAHERGPRGFVDAEVSFEIGFGIRIGVAAAGGFPITRGLQGLWARGAEREHGRDARDGGGGGRWREGWGRGERGGWGEWRS